VADRNKLQKLIKIESISKVSASMLVGALFDRACPDFLTAEKSQNEPTQRAAEENHQFEMQAAVFLRPLRAFPLWFSAIKLMRTLL
jgi:hypothetical protein